MGAPVVDIDPPEGGGMQTAKDLFSGAMGGIAQVLIGKFFSVVESQLTVCGLP